ncbi:phosphotriesterase [Methanobrevibacter sp.]|uniref:phosphotriesterase family protein n=1 Tax=Methanobrevibacter sp. TaxID=66852 RepID=UPI003890145B
MLQTVNGKIKKDNLGKALIHEHISCASNDFIKAFGTKWLDRNFLVEYASNVLADAKKKYNIGLIVDGTPIDLGRDISLLKKVSDKSGVHIVASSGFYWFPSFEFVLNDEYYIAELLISECKNGIEGTDIKPGILKCAVGYPGITNDIMKRLKAVSIAQRETGLPLYVHCEHKGNSVFEQIDFFVDLDVNVEKIIIGHSAIRPDYDYLKSILNLGCYVSIDQCHCCGYELSDIAKIIIKLCSDGYGDKILISNDYCIHSDFAEKSKNGLNLNVKTQVENLGFVFDVLYDKYKYLGGNDDVWNRITTENVINILDV